MSLPQEIVDLILDKIGDTDRCTIAACALTSYSFSHPARRRQFSTIVIPDAHDAKRTQKQVNDLFNLLNASPDIISIIRTLDIRCRHIPHLKIDDKSGIHKLLRALRSCGSKVERLSLQCLTELSRHGDLSWSNIEALTKASLVDFLQQLKVVSLNHVIGIPIEALTSIPGLRRLDLGSVLFSSYMPSQTLPPPSASSRIIAGRSNISCHLESLNVSGCYTISRHTLLLSDFAWSTIRSVKAVVSNGSDAFSLWNLLQNSQEVLQTLELSLYSTSCDFFLRNGSFDLGALTALRTVRLHILRLSCLSPTEYYEAIFNVLDPLTPTNITRIEITLDVSNYVVGSSAYDFPFLPNTGVIFQMLQPQRLLLKHPSLKVVHIVVDLMKTLIRPSNNYSPAPAVTWLDIDASVRLGMEGLIFADQPSPYSRLYPPDVNFEIEVVAPTIPW